MFSDLNILAIEKLESLSKGLSELKPLKTDSLSFTVEQTITNPEKIIQKARQLTERKSPYIYTLCVESEEYLELLRAAFSEARELNTNDRKYARLNKSISPCLYVGSSSDIAKRLKEHIGQGVKQTYALHICHWATDFPQVEIEFDFAQYEKNTNQELLQTLEDVLWEKQNPMFGRQGSK